MPFFPSSLPLPSPSHIHISGTRGRSPSFHYSSTPLPPPNLLSVISVICCFKIEIGFWPYMALPTKTFQWYPTTPFPGTIRPSVPPQAPSPPSSVKSGMCSLLCTYLVSECLPGTGQYFKRFSYINSFNLMITLR